jgi:hypothetical protein
MATNKDFEDLLHLLNSVHAKYLIVGAYAVIFYTEPRYTKDIDIWVQPTLKNAQKVHQALQRFGAPVKDLTIADLSNPALVYQIGIEPNRIDILMGMGKLPFDQAWRHRRVSHYGKEKMYLLDRKDLVRAKKGTGRLQDQLDVQLLSHPTRRKKA